MTDSADRLKKLEETVQTVKEAIEEVKESGENYDDLNDKLNDLTSRIRAAREDPAAFNENTYGDLARDLVTVIPDHLPLPEAAKQAITLLAESIASFIEGAAGFSLTVVARTFRAHLNGGKTPEEAARLASANSSVQAWLLSNYHAGLITGAGDTRVLKGPLDRMGEAIKGFFESLVPDALKKLISGLYLQNPVATLAVAVVLLAALLLPAFFLLTSGEATEPTGDGGTASSPASATGVAVNPIGAVAGPTTEYVVEVTRLPAGETPTFAWSGATCGKATASANRYSWDHREVVVGLTGGLGNRELGRSGDCDHKADPTHGNPMIVVDIDSKSFKARCTFRGAGSGTGEHCEVSRK